MKKKTMTAVLLMVLCLGLFAGCTDTQEEETADTTAATGDTSVVEEIEQAQEEAAEAVIGQVTYVGDTYLSLMVMETEEIITDYAAMDLTALTETATEDYVYLYSDAVYYAVSGGSLVEASAEELTEECIVAVTTNADGIQEVVILQVAQEPEEEDVTVYYYEELVAKVTDVYADGTLELEEYALSEDMADYVITDYTAVELSNYTATGIYQTHTLAEDCEITLVEAEMLTLVEADSITIGDTLVIYTNDEGTACVSLYPAAADAEE